MRVSMLRDLVLKVLLLVHHDLELGGDLLLLFKLTFGLGLGHLRADHVPADDGGEEEGDGERHQQKARGRARDLAVDGRRRRRPVFR